MINAAQKSVALPQPPLRLLRRARAYTTEDASAEHDGNSVQVWEDASAEHDGNSQEDASVFT